MIHIYKYIGDFFVQKTAMEEEAVEYGVSGWMSLEDMKSNCVIRHVTY